MINGSPRKNGSDTVDVEKVGYEKKQNIFLFENVSESFPEAVDRLR